MSPYSQTLATARLDALQGLMQALKDADTPDEKRRCAVAIFNAPDPCDLDDTIEWDDENDDKDGDDETNSNSNRAAIPSATGSPAALSGQPVLNCNTDTPSPDLAPTRDSSRAPLSLYPNSFPNHPELAHLTDDQILFADSADLMQLMLTARCHDTSAPGDTGGSPASDGAPGP